MMFSTVVESSRHINSHLLLLCMKAYYDIIQLKDQLNFLEERMKDLEIREPIYSNDLRRICFLCDLSQIILFL